MGKCLCALAVVSWILAAAGRAEAQDDARAVIDKAIKAYGGEEKLAKFKAESWKAKGTIQLGGAKLPYNAEYFFQQPDKYRFVMGMEFGGQKFELTAVLNGDKAWEKAMDQVQEMAKEKLTEFRHQVYTIYISQLTPLKDKAFTLASLGEIKVDGKPAAGVKVSRKDHRDVNLYFDKASGLLAKIESRVMDEFVMKEVTQEALFSNYFDKDGVKYFKTLTIKRDGNLFIEEEFSDQKTAEKLDEKLFTKP